MKLFIIFFSFIILLSCTLTEPSCLVIKNESDYTIEVSLNNGNKKELTIQKNKGEMILVNPGEIRIKVSIELIKYDEEYSVNIKYLEKKKFVFSI